MIKWRPISTAPRDGTWIRARGWNFGVPGTKFHSVIAVYQDRDWFDATDSFASEKFLYLHEWKPYNPTKEK